MEGPYIGLWKCPLWPQICVRAQVIAQFMSLGQHRRQRGPRMKIIPLVSVSMETRKCIFSIETLKISPSDITVVYDLLYL